MITRRNAILGLISLPTVPLFPVSAIAEGGLFPGVPLMHAPGDYGYKHLLYHEEYKKVFGEIGKCSCGAGDCRVTDWRKTQLGSPLGYDIIAYRQWLPLPEKVWIPRDDQIPERLRGERAHVCAYAIAEISIPCVIIKDAQG